jgi:hypothetical protein
MKSNVIDWLVPRGMFSVQQSSLLAQPLDTSSWQLIGSCREVCFPFNKARCLHSHYIALFKLAVDWLVPRGMFSVQQSSTPLHSPVYSS